MTWLIWTGAAASFVGLVGLVWCILRVWRAKRAAMDDDALRDLVRRTIPLNMGAFFLSALGLMAVIVGVSLG